MSVVCECVCWWCVCVVVCVCVCGDVNVVLLCVCVVCVCVCVCVCLSVCLSLKGGGGGGGREGSYIISTYAEVNASQRLSFRTAGWVRLLRIVERGGKARSVEGPALRQRSTQTGGQGVGCRGWRGYDSKEQTGPGV